VAFDYEGEVAAVIGAPLHLARREEAAAAIAGYACYNDFSERQWQRHSPQWTPGKNFPGTGGFGPFFVPVSDVADPRNMDLRTRVNGELRQSATFADLIHDVPTLLSYISTFTPPAPW
jgi:2-keto-4-pentenoate hydratase/2-oxohepta-3-ene-1,7-dioic acid hydratase in catechol pathway